MWEYKIIPCDLGFNIYRKKEELGIGIVERLNGFGQRTWNRESAKIFYHKDDALSALVIHKSRCNGKTA